MPLPEPGENEKEDDFISRCIPLTLTDQGLDKDDEDDRAEATAICFSQFRKAREGGDSMSDATRITFDQWVKEELGLEDKLNAVRDAFYAKFERGYDQPLTSSNVWIQKVEDDYIVAQLGDGGPYFRVDYTVDDEGNVEFGEPEEGEWEFSATEAEETPEKKAQKARAAKHGKAVTESVRISEVTRAFEQEDLEGKVWLVRIIKAHRSMNGNYYPPELLESDETIAIFEGVRVYDNHLSDEEWAEKRGHRNVNREYMGWIDGVYYEDEALWGHFHVADIILREKMKTVWEAGRKDEFGFSIDAGVEMEKREMNGEQVNYILKFLDRDSVDVVFDPSAGGRMERMLEQHKVGGKNMTNEELTKALEGMSDEERQAFLAQFNSAADGGEPKPADDGGEPKPADDGVELKPADDDGEPKPADDGEPKPADDGGEPKPVGDAGEPKPASDVLTAMMAEAEKKMAAVDLKMYQVALKEALAESKLPAKAREFIYDQFQGRVFDMKDIHKAIEAQRGILATATESGRVKGMGGLRISAGPVLEVSSFEYALQRMLGCLDPADEAKAPKGLRGIQEWYRALTADYEFSGKVAGHRVTEANVTTATVTSIIKDVLNKRILDLYATQVARRWWEPLVKNYDEETIHDVYVYQTYGIGALPTVPEGDPYTEAVWGDYEETASFEKKGKFIGVTLETFMKDNLNALRRIPEVLNRAWFYTLQTGVSYLFTQNTGAGATIATTGRYWFNSTEANLGSGSAYALAYDTFNGAQVAIFDMAEAGSSEPLGLLGKYLIVSSANSMLAEQIRTSEKDPDNANNPNNIWRNRFEVVVVPKWNTNTSRWYVMADPADAPLIGLHWYRGQRAPSLFQAESELTGAMFTNDVMRWKIRNWFAISLADHIGAYGAVPA